MAQRPRTVPLFDLVPGKKSGDAAARTVVSPPIPKLPAQPAEVELKPIPRDEKPREYSPREFTDTTRPLGSLATTASDKPAAVPMPLVYVGIFVALLLMLGTYLLGTRVGAGKKEQELAGVLRKDPPAVREATGAGNSPLGNLQPSDTKPTNPKSPQQPAPVPNDPTVLAGVAFPSVPEDAFDNPPADSEFMLASDRDQGWVSRDPRQQGLNYMTLGVFSRRDAGYAIMLLRSNGLEAIGVPVDKGLSGANNRGPANYRVWLLQGVTSEQWRKNDSIKNRLDSRVREIGKAWKQMKGPSDFADAYWDKLD